MKRMMRSGRAQSVAAITMTAGLLLTLASAAVRGATPASQPAPRAPGGPTSQPALPPGHPGSGVPGMPEMPSGHPGTGGKPSTPVPGLPGRPIERKPTNVKSVLLRSYHRVFHDFVEDETVTMYKEFTVGDTDYTAEVVEYIPDFAMDLKDHKIFSRSDEPKNPALRILVKQKGVPQDTTWALLNMPPHFAKKSLLAFKILRLDIKGHKPILAPEPAAPKSDAPAAGGQKS